MLRFGLITRNKDTRCESGYQVSSVSPATLTHITVYNLGLKCDGHAWPNIAKSLISKSLIASLMLRILLNRVFPAQPWKTFGADTKKMRVLCVVLYPDFLTVTPKATLCSHFHVSMKQRNLRGDWANTECGFCGSPSAQKWYGADNDVVVTALVLQYGHIPELFIAILWLCLCKDQEATLCLSTTNPPSPVCESLPGFFSRKRSWHNALALTGAPIQTLL